MSLLLIIWLLSLFLLSSILGFAFAYKKKHAAFPQNEALPSVHFSEFLAAQCYGLLYHTQRVLDRVRPHARNFGVVIAGYSARGHDFFVERVFGRTEIKKGISTSFFLKSIAEYKVGTRTDGSRG